MAKSRGNPKKKQHSQGKGGKLEKSSSYKRPRHERLEIKFDPEARRKYLTSFSSKKKERRAFGLAMQKVKDRKAKLDEKREMRKARLEQVEEAEKSKALELEDSTSIKSEEDDVAHGQIDRKEPLHDQVTTFADRATQSQYGGQVIVTTTYHIPSDDEEEASYLGDRKNIDKEQMYAGSVQKYMAKIKGSLPGKRSKNRDRNNAGGKKGKHGAEGMKGMGSAQDLKLAKKTLSKTRERQDQNRRKHSRR